MKREMISFNREISPKFSGNYPNYLGFTMIELTIIIVIVGIIATLSYVGFSAVISKNKLISATHELEGAFSNARTQARTERRSFTIQLDFAAEKYIYFEDKDGSGALSNPDNIINERTFPSGIDLWRGYCGQYAGEGYSLSILTVIFYPDGTTNGATENYFILKSGNRRGIVYLNRHTGRVKSRL